MIQAIASNFSSLVPLDLLYWFSENRNFAFENVARV
jgi:hypothetical protein